MAHQVFDQLIECVFVKLSVLLHICVMWTHENNICSTYYVWFPVYTGLVEVEFPQSTFNLRHGRIAIIVVFLFCTGTWPSYLSDFASQGLILG